MRLLSTHMSKREVLCTEPAEVVAEALGCTAEHAEAPAAQAPPSPADAEQPAELVAAAPASAKLTPRQPRITVQVAAAGQAAPEAATEESAPTAAAAVAPAAAEAPPAAAQHAGNDTCVVCSKDAGKKVLPCALRMLVMPLIRKISTNQGRWWMNSVLHSSCRGEYGEMYCWWCR